MEEVVVVAIEREGEEEDEEGSEEGVVECLRTMPSTSRDLRMREKQR